jgi:diguanylate cyclase (GGDEF)-like protein
LLILIAFGIPAIAWYRRTNEKRRADAQILFLAHHDSVTGLFNRISIVKQLDTALSALQQNRSLAVHHIDMDRFKDVNDTLGHDAGDRLIKQIAERLFILTDDDDVVGRLGGDEFVIVQKSANNPSRLAHEIAEALRKPFVLNGQEISVSGSVGVAVAPKDGRNAERLMKSADLALYKCKTDGRKIAGVAVAQTNGRDFKQVTVSADLPLFECKTGGRNYVRFFEPEMDAELEEPDFLSGSKHFFACEGATWRIFRPLCSFPSLNRWGSLPKLALGF